MSKLLILSKVERALNQVFSSKKSLNYHIQSNSEGKIWGKTAHNFISLKIETRSKNFLL